MQTINLGAVDRNQVRRQIRLGRIYTRVNPDLLTEKELLPCLPHTPVKAPALSLAPFPASVNHQGELAEAKIRHCYGPKEASPFISKRVEAIIQRWYDPNPRPGREYHWYDLDYSKCPYPPLIRDTLSAIPDKETPQQGDREKGRPFLDCWETPIPDELGYTVLLGAREYKDDWVTLAVSLSHPKAQQTNYYLVTPDRYHFFLGLFFQLLGERLAPTQISLPTGRFRGRIYRRPQ